MAAVNDFLSLLEEVPAEEWSTPTDLAGWDVKAVAAHIAHLEGILAGTPEETAEVGEPPHVSGRMGSTPRPAWSTAATPAPTRSSTSCASVAKPHTALLADPPTDGDGGPRSLRWRPWSWRTLLRNRPLDVWMHEQDVRRASAAPATWTLRPPSTPPTTSPRASASSGQDDRRPPGTTACSWTRSARRVRGRRRDGRRRPSARRPGVTLHLDRESFIRARRRPLRPEPGGVRVEGDQELGQRVLDHLATTP